MATPDQESIETFMSITGSSELVAIQKLTEHAGNLNQAVNSHFTEGDTNARYESNAVAPHEDFMDVDDDPSETATHRLPFSPLPPARQFDDVINTLPRNVSRTRGALILDDDDDDDDFPSVEASNPEGLIEQNQGVIGGISHDTQLIPSAPEVSYLPDYGIEEEMIQAAIEASKREAEISKPNDAVPPQSQPQSEDPEIANAVSASLRSAAQEKSESEAGPSETRSSKLPEVEEDVKLASSSNGRLDIETEDADEQPLVRHRTRSSRNTQHQNVNNPMGNETEFPSEWGGISSEEHDEAVMLEAAMFGGIPEGSGYHARNHYMRNGFGGPYTRSTPRPSSPSLTAQRLIREQQDDEYLAALQADREKELLEQAAKEAAIEEERKKEEEEQEIERQLAAKEASLPQEPSSDDENAVNLLVRMPDGSRRGRRFLRTDKLQHLFDFIDVGRVIKPSTYRLVRPYPRRAYSDGESNLTLNELGLTSKQEALFLELI